MLIKRPIKRIVVTGSRMWDDRDRLFVVLDRLHGEHSLMLVAHGDARGADRMAGMWAYNRGVATVPFLVSGDEWSRYGKAAGARRNQRMLEEIEPDLVVVFIQEPPTSRGTRDMLRRAQYAGFPVKICYAAKL